MASKQTIQLLPLTKQSSAKDLASQLAGKKNGPTGKTWIQTFAASGGKQGGKVR